MGGKKKKGKGKEKGEDAKPKEPYIPDFTPANLEPLPISVKVRRFKDVYIIYTDEYHKSIEIKEQLCKIMNLPADNIKLYLPNKRPIEDGTSNHDQALINGITLFAVIKPEDGEWDNVNEVIKFDESKPTTEQ